MAIVGGCCTISLMGSLVYGYCYPVAWLFTFFLDGDNGGRELCVDGESRNRRRVGGKNLRF